MAAHVAAFTSVYPVGAELCVGRDLRPSSPDLAAIVTQAKQMVGLQETYCWAVPTPALALAKMGAGASAVMITRSHIPADHNGPD